MNIHPIQLGQNVIAFIPGYGEPDSQEVLGVSQAPTDSQELLPALYGDSGKVFHRHCDQHGTEIPCCVLQTIAYIFRGRTQSKVMPLGAAFLLSVFLPPICLCCLASFGSMMLAAGDGGLSCGQATNRYAEWGAAHVIDTNLVPEFH